MTPPDDPTVYIVDDDVSALRSLARLLRAAGFHVAVHNSTAECFEQLPRDANGCLITDLIMPGMSGIDLQDALRQSGNPIPIIFLTGQGDIPTSVRAMRSGAEDFLTKNAPKEALLDAVHRALAHNAEIRARHARETAVRRPFEALTEREREVLRHVVRGLLNKQIAAELGIHERTVKLHRTHLTAKLGVHSVAELTRMVDDAGIFRQTPIPAATSSFQRFSAPAFSPNLPQRAVDDLQTRKVEAVVRAVPTRLQPDTR